MPAQHYVIKKIGDRYVPVAQEQMGATAAWTAGGGLLAGIGLMRGGVLGWAAALTGAGVIYRGLTGRNILSELRLACAGQHGRLPQGPSYQHDFKDQAGQKPSDAIDEASMESFPASDAPAHTTSTAS